MKCPQCNFDNPDTQRFCGECAAPLIPGDEIAITKTKLMDTSIKELSTGATFAGRYQIIEELGKGGMGKVYKALDQKINEKIALKLIKPEIASDKKIIERFSNELKIARKIGHRNVGRMYHLSEDEGTHYITMEYVSGEDLKSMIRMSSQLGLGTTINIAKQVCEGLAEAHRLGVVHRDLKPSNIMIDKEGNARIMDFGIARSLKAKGITGADVMIGTPEYMSPEQVEAKEVDQRSDIYSLGVILYEMVAGRIPFEGDSSLSIAIKHKTEEPLDPRKFNTQLSEDLSRVILKCLEKDKVNRYQSAEELQSELQNIEKGIPTTERKIPERKPLTSREITVTFGLKKLIIPASIIIALIIIGIGLWKILSPREAALIPSDKPSLGILYFKNNTGDESLDIWRTALSDSLITDLSQSKHIRVLSADGLYSIIKQMNLLEAINYTSEDLKRIASQGRVNHILQGNYSKAGDDFRIEITLQDVNTMELIGSERVEGTGEKSIFSMVDELTRRIKANFRLTEEQIASDIDEEVGKITTESPEAYKLYSQGRKYHDAEPMKSIGFMQKALAIDPEFAMAYRSVAVSFSNMGLEPAARKAFKKAFELSDRASERERYIIKGDYFRQTENTYDKAIEVYDKLLELYPDDEIGGVNLGVLYYSLEEWDKAIKQYDVLIQIGSESPFPYSNSALAHAAKGLYKRATDVLEDYLNNVSDLWTLRYYLSNIYLCQGKYDLALSELNKAMSIQPRTLPPAILLVNRASIFQLQGDWIEAEKEYRNLLESTDTISPLLGKRAITNLYLTQGKFAESMNQLEPNAALREPFAYTYLKYMNPQQALKECDRLWKSAVDEEDLSLQRKALHFKGLIFLRMNSTDEVQRVAEEFKQLIEKGMNKKKIRHYYHLMGMIELKKENHSQAIEYFKQTISLLSYQRGGIFQSLDVDDHALFIDPLASAYFNSGDLNKAREEYEKIILLTTGRLYYGDIYAKSFYMLGRIYEKQGDKAKAIEHYEKFLDLWKDANPGIAEVEDAKRRLAGLQKIA